MDDDGTFSLRRFLYLKYATWVEYLIFYGLTHFRPMFPFFYPWKHLFSEATEREKWNKRVKEMHAFSKEHCSSIMASNFCNMRFLFFSLDYLWNVANSMRKHKALARIANYIKLPKRCILMNAFLKSQFNYCPAIWIFHSRALQNKINRLHEICLRIIYNDKLSNFEELLHQAPDKNNAKANFQENLPGKVRFQKKWGEHAPPAATPFFQGACTWR